VVLVFNFHQHSKIQFQELELQDQEELSIGLLVAAVVEVMYLIQLEAQVEEVLVEVLQPMELQEHKILEVVVEEQDIYQLHQVFQIFLVLVVPE
jgi:hypothetical protein